MAELISRVGFVTLGETWGSRFKSGGPQLCCTFVGAMWDFFTFQASPHA